MEGKNMSIKDSAQTSKSNKVREINKKSEEKKTRKKKGARNDGKIMARELQKKER